MDTKTYFTTYDVSDVHQNQLDLSNNDELSSLVLDGEDLTNVSQIVIIYPFGDVYPIYAFRKDDQYEISFDRDIFSVSLEDAIAMSEIYYRTEDIMSIRSYVTSLTNFNL
jgi:hypothetical protein